MIFNKMYSFNKYWGGGGGGENADDEEENKGKMCMTFFAYELLHAVHSKLCYLLVYLSTKHTFLSDQMRVSFLAKVVKFHRRAMKT